MDGNPASHAGLHDVLEQVSCFTCSCQCFPTEAMVSLQKCAGTCRLSIGTYIRLRQFVDPEQV
ncbi:hypothetical protein PAHAL_3G442800 [Panicum hallii]|uniref:Uncharacterized protein n=1 Tax=Panicum hallii TaxID=206008 RepID=A0A2S3HE50_9POAL|nr:hypothetical protein PAHAL_3G442800 [Panicum hallii]